MATAFSFTRDGLFYDVHKFEHMQKHDEFVRLYIPKDREDGQPWLFKGAPIYALMWPILNEKQQTTTILDLIFAAGHLTTEGLTAANGLLDWDLSIVTSEGTFHDRSIALNFSPDQKMLWAKKDNAAFPHLFRMAETQAKLNPEWTFQQALQSILDLNFFGEFYYVSQPSWFSDAQNKWGSKGSDSGSDVDRTDS